MEKGSWWIWYLSRQAFSLDPPASSSLANKSVPPRPGWLPPERMHSADYERPFLVGTVSVGKYSLNWERLLRTQIWFSKSLCETEKSITEKQNQTAKVQHLVTKCTAHVASSSTWHQLYFSASQIQESPGCAQPPEPCFNRTGREEIEEIEAPGNGFPDNEARSIVNLQTEVARSQNKKLSSKGRHRIH